MHRRSALTVVRRAMCRSLTSTRAAVAALKEELDEEAKRRNRLHFKTPEALRYNERGDRGAGQRRLKDEFGGRMVRVRGQCQGDVSLDVWGSHTHG